MYDEIIKAAIEEFNEKGIKFTMDDLAERMRISKRTIYDNITSKEALIANVIERVFYDIKQQEKEIVNDPKLVITEKICRVICILPRNYTPINYAKVYEIKRFYPYLYKEIDDHLAGEWEVTLSLVKAGIEAGAIRDIDVNVFRQVILGTMRNIFDEDFLMSNGITYEEALKKMMDIVMKGMII